MKIFESHMMRLSPGRVAKVVRRHEGPLPKSLDMGENFKPYHFVAILNFVAIYALFGNLWAKKVLFFGQKQCFLGKKCTITCIL